MNNMSTSPQISNLEEQRWTVTGYAAAEARPHRARNISDTERWISTFGGSALLAVGLSRIPFGGLLAGVIGGSLLYRGLTGHCHLYDSLGLNTAETNPATAVPAQQGVKVERTLVISRPPEELYAFWREVENLPQIMPHLNRVEALDRRRSHWEAVGPFGKLVQWDAEIIKEREPEMISWRSLEGGDVETAGSVHFKPLAEDRGTVVTISMKYNPPAGKIGATIASLLGQGLEQELDESLVEFKRLMESSVPSPVSQPREQEQQAHS